MTRRWAAGLPGGSFRTAGARAGHRRSRPPLLIRTTMHRSRRTVVRSLLALLVAAPLAACGDSTAPLVTIDDVMYAPSLNVDLAASTRTASGLAYQDLQVGTGALAAPGATATVSYTGRLVDGTGFDASSPARPTLTFAIGDVPNAQRVVPGFEEGVTGMRVGGRRKLIIPPALAYGRQGELGNQVLVFDVELVSVP